MGAAVAVVVLLPTAIMLFPALGLKTGMTGALIVVLLGLAALRARRRGAAPALVAALAVLVCTAIGLSVDRFDAAHPAPTQLMYALDADNGTARWISAEPAVQKWTSQYVTGRSTAVDDTLPSFGPEPVHTGPATAASLPAPLLTVESDARSGDTRTMTLRLQPQRQVRLTSLHVATATTVTAATVAGRPVPTGRDAHGAWGFGFVFHGPPADGVEIKLTLRASGPVEFRVMDGSDGLNALPGFHARPADVGILGSHTSELLAVAKTYSL